MTAEGEQRMGMRAHRSPSASIIRNIFWPVRVDHMGPTVQTVQKMTNPTASDFLVNFTGRGICHFFANWVAWPTVHSHGPENIPDNLDPKRWKSFFTYVIFQCVT